MRLPSDHDRQRCPCPADSGRDRGNRLTTISNDVEKATDTPGTYGPASFQQARADIRDLITTPLQAWILIPPDRRTETVYQSLLTIPLDLAAAGYIVTVSQEETSWRLDVRKKMLTGCMLHLYGVAPSWVTTLYRFADLAIIRIDDAECRARRASEQEGADA